MPSTAAPVLTAATAPGALPVLGHGHRLLRGPVGFLSSLHEHGDLVAVRLGPTAAHVPCHPGPLAQVLGDDRLFDKGGVFYDRARDAAGNGLVTCPHRDHRRQRRLVQPAFRRPQLAHYADAMRAEADAAAAGWRPGLVVDAFPVFYGIALRTPARTLYSTAIGAELASGVERSFDTVLNGLFRQMFLPAPVRRLPLPGNLRYHRALARPHAATRQLVAAHRDGGAGDGTDLLSALLAAERRAPSGPAAPSRSDLSARTQVRSVPVRQTRSSDRARGHGEDVGRWARSGGRKPLFGGRAGGGRSAAPGWRGRRRWGPVSGSPGSRWPRCPGTASFRATTRRSSAAWGRSCWSSRRSSWPVCW
ncbi:cytochrome P450 [Kitasatospora cineracea]|uniref:Cytochrome P450 n=1 Tax=Kitasatospora cineracea TaxID=88074 RepID=A0A3N4RTZ4_9ACTN|nr:cytochrome P450 [Kitasatospora cineracea]RPE36833.1 cytochrome P450 [Kitasatospora cineracea]